MESCGKEYEHHQLCHLYNISGAQYYVIPAEGKDIPVVVTAPLVDCEQGQHYHCTHVRSDG